MLRTSIATHEQPSASGMASKETGGRSAAPVGISSTGTETSAQLPHSAAPELIPCAPHGCHVTQDYFNCIYYAINLRNFVVHIPMAHSL